MQIQYLEIVTPEVDATCKSYAMLHGVTFSDPEPGLGNARTATLANGGMIGVRAPMHESEDPVVRPYMLVDDIEAAAKLAAEAGGEIAHPPMEIPGHGKFAIYFQGGALADLRVRSLAPRRQVVNGSQAPYRQLTQLAAEQDHIRVSLHHCSKDVITSFGPGHLTSNQCHATLKVSDLAQLMGRCGDYI
jgi:predicted enzyme related to lactoylglutathione lyase